jgi:prepilin-type N-terminal cleavage/methylation domain-containing protein
MKWKKPVNNQKGFTLVEIAIVLIIIGLILGATIKGKDLMQSAKQKKFYNAFVKQWEILILNYYDRTGNVLGDTTNNGRFNNINSNAEFTTLQTEIDRVGLDSPVTNTNNIYQYTFKGQSSGTQIVNIRLMYRNPNNVLEFTNMPTDLAIALDNIVDGNADGTTGDFISSDGSDWDASTTTGTTTVTSRYIMNIP